jgi:hypothetical protein
MNISDTNLIINYLLIVSLCVLFVQLISIGKEYVGIHKKKKWVIQLLNIIIDYLCYLSESVD